MKLSRLKGLGAFTIRIHDQAIATVKAPQAMGDAMAWLDAALLGLDGFTVLGQAEVGGELELLIETTADLELMHLAALRRRLVAAVLDRPSISWRRPGPGQAVLDAALTPAPPRSRVPASGPGAMCPAQERPEPGTLPRGQGPSAPCASRKAEDA